MSATSNEERKTALQGQAIEWLVKMRDDQVTAQELNAFADWLAEDPSHSQAYTASENLFNDMIAASPGLAPPNQTTHQFNAPKKATVRPLKRPHPLSPYPIQTSRFWLRSAIGITAAWLLAVGLVFPEQSHLIGDMLSDYRTDTGELREVRLSDGSHLLLNGNSAVSVDFNATARSIILHHGQVRYVVAKDLSRPFLVMTDELTVRALGTIFDVYASGRHDTRIFVEQHAVSAIFPPLASRNETHDSVTISEGQQLRYTSGSALPQAEKVKIDQATAWQQRKLIINDQPLAELVSELARYRNGRIFLVGDELKNLRVTGVFSLDHPDEIIHHVSKALALNENRIGPWWIVLHR